MNISGSTKEVFELVTSHLKTHGLFAFSIEYNESEEDYLLRESGRYAQSPDYIRHLAKNSGLTITTSKPVTVRREGKLPLAGYVFVLVLQS